MAELEIYGDELKEQAEILLELLEKDEKADLTSWQLAFNKCLKKIHGMLCPIFGQ